MSKEENVKHQPAKLTTAEEIWNEIKDRDLNLFALAGQKVSDYCTPAPIDPTKCYLLYKVSSVISQLELAIGNNYDYEAVNKYIVVSRKKFPV